MVEKAPPPPRESGKGAQAPKKTPPPPSQKKIQPPTRKPAAQPKLPPIKKKGRGKIWAGVIGIIIGIILIFALQGMSFLPFVGVLVILIGVYLLYKGLTDVDKVLVSEKITAGGKTRTKMVYKPKKTLNKGAIFLFIVFIFFALPIFLTIFQFGNVSDQPYSIYNTGDGGCSLFREDLESNEYETSAIISSYSEIIKFSEDYPLNRTILFVIGAKLLFFMDSIHLIELLDSGGYIVFLQDQGTTNEAILLMGLFDWIRIIFGVPPGGYANPLDLPFQDGYLCQGAGGDPSYGAFTASLSITGDPYDVRFWTASPLGGSMGLMSIFDYTPSDVWLDLNKNFVQESEDVTQASGYALTAKSSTGNVIYIGDADILTNKLMNEPGAENRAFAAALVYSLTGGDTSWKIIFDESHQLKQGYSGAFYFGTIIAIEDFLLLSWLFAPLGPWLAFKLTKRFIPEAEKPEKVKLSTVRREGESLYSKRLNWFKSRRRYERALALLSRRLKRSLTKILNMKGFEKEEVISRILGNYPEGEVDEKRIVKAFETFEEVEKGRRVLYEEEFMKIFLEMQWIADLAAPK